MTDPPSDGGEPAAGAWAGRCRYRSMPGGGEGRAASACCLLAGGLYGTENTDWIYVSDAACEQCVRQFPPAPDNLNVVAASVVCAVGERIRDADPDHWERCGGNRVMARAEAALPVISTVPMSADRPLEPYGGECFYLGEQTGTRPCVSCKGSVVQKEFRCLHERHESTVIRDCQRCPDYDRALTKGRIENWAVGVTTAGRDDPTLGRSLESLAEAGWDDVQVFAEPGSVVPGPVPPWRVTRRTMPLGAWPNWLLSLQELALRFPRADAYLICQDDVLYHPELRAYLEAELWPSRSPGVVSLHLATHQHGGQAPGFSRVEFGWSAWGAQAYVFPNPSVRALMRHPLVVNHRHRGPRGGVKNIDSVVGAWCEASGLGYYMHYPSLTQHIGETSTLWGANSISGRRGAGSFETGVSGGLPGRTGGGAAGGGAGGVVRVRGTLTISCVLVGRERPFEAWLRWIGGCELAMPTTLRLVDQSGDARFAAMLAGEVERLRRTGRFADVVLERGSVAPAGAERRSPERDENIAGGYSRALEGATGEFGFLMDCDTTPPVDGLVRLHRTYCRLRDEGKRPGVVSGVYESAQQRGHLVASRTVPTWGRAPRVGEVGPGDVSEMGYVGSGCLYFEHGVLEGVLPLKPGHMSGVGGPDSYLCEELRRRGFTIWLDGGVACEHLL